MTRWSALLDVRPCHRPQILMPLRSPTTGPTPPRRWVPAARVGSGAKPRKPDHSARGRRRTTSVGGTTAGFATRPSAEAGLAVAILTDWATRGGRPARAAPASSPRSSPRPGAEPGPGGAVPARSPRSRRSPGAEPRWPLCRPGHRARAPAQAPSPARVTAAPASSPRSRPRHSCDSDAIGLDRPLARRNGNVVGQQGSTSRTTLPDAGLWPPPATRSHARARPSGSCRPAPRGWDGEPTSPRHARPTPNALRPPPESVDVQTRSGPAQRRPGRGRRRLPPPSGVRRARPPR